MKSLELEPRPTLMKNHVSREANTLLGQKTSQRLSSWKENLWQNNGGMIDEWKKYPLKYRPYIPRMVKIEKPDSIEAGREQQKGLIYKWNCNTMVYPNHKPCQILSKFQITFKLRQINRQAGIKKIDVFFFPLPLSSQNITRITFASLREIPS